MSGSIVDLLMVTHNRPKYTDIALSGLLSRISERTRVWLWHNGDHKDTLDVVHKYLNHPRVYRFHHEPNPQVSASASTMLAVPVNWMWREGEGDYVAKLDDDCLCSEDWTGKLSQALDVNPRVGALGCWIHHERDFDQDLAKQRIVNLEGGHQMLRTRYLGGRGYMLRRECIRQFGALTTTVPFYDYMMKIAAEWDVGVYYPLIVMDHFDDTRSPHTALRTDADLVAFAPLTAKQRRMTRLSEWKTNQQYMAYLTLTHKLTGEMRPKKGLAGLKRRITDFLGFRSFLWRRRNGTV